MGPDRGRGLEVAQAVAHARRPLERDIEALGYGEKHSRIGLAAGRLGLGRIGAIEHRLDASARLVYGSVHLGVDGIQACHVHERSEERRVGKECSTGWW